MKNDREKRLNNLRIIATNLFMGVSVLVIVAVLIGVAMGYSINKNGELERSGLIRVKSVPGDALVEVDGEKQFSRTEMSKLLSAGEREIMVTKSGFDIWRNTVTIEEGLMSRLDWIRLFPSEEVIERVHEYKDLKLMSVSSDRRFILMLSQSSLKAQIINIRSDEIQYTDVNLLDVLGLLSKDDFSGEIQIMEWNKNSDKILLRWEKGEGLGVNWVLMDAVKPENSLNLSEELMMDFSDVRILGDTADRLWALEDGNLRVIDLTLRVGVSGVLLKNVEKLKADGASVIYLERDDDGKRSIGVYKEGEKGSVKVQSVAEDITKVALALSSYNGKKWIAYSLDERYFVRRGDELPSYKKSAGGLKVVAENDLGFTPSDLMSSPTGRFAVALSSQNVRVLDLELDRRFEYLDSLPENGTFGWLNNYLIWSNLDTKLMVRDFDGANLRELASVADGFPVVMTTNNHWLYFVKENKNNNLELLRKRVY